MKAKSSQVLAKSSQIQIEPDQNQAKSTSSQIKPNQAEIQAETKPRASRNPAKPKPDQASQAEPSQAKPSQAARESFGEAEARSPWPASPRSHQGACELLSPLRASLSEPPGGLRAQGGPWEVTAVLGKCQKTMTSRKNPRD